ncbi:MAG TPA: hypothetical protein VME01_01495, partial [Solirubrobacteraceae bacterium]|nr:hypothetical protein [Solirubrobacteraceae bacterium]
MFATTVVTSIAGFGFWWMAARFWQPADIGAAGAAISAIQLLGIVGMLGLGTLLVGELAKATTDRRELISTALFTSCVCGTICGLVFAVVIRCFTRAQTIPPGILGVVAFVAAVGVTSALLVFDDATIGLGRGRWQLNRNIAFSVAKF